MHILVVHLTAVSSYRYQNGILIGFSELNQGLACQVVKAHMVPLLCLDGQLSVFFKQLQCTCTILHVKCKESSALIKLQVAYMGLRIKSREKTIVRASEKEQEKIVIVWDFFGKIEIRFQFFHLLFINCQLKCLRPTYFTMYIDFIMFSLKQEKPNDTLLSLYNFLNAMHSKAKVSLI